MITLSHTSEIIAAGTIVVLLVIVITTTIFIRRRPRRLNVEHYQKRWLEAQKLCASKNTWPLAVINADKLLDDALKRLHYKGKTMGERLVAAQHDISNNDGVWFGHKLRNQLVHEDRTKLTKKDIREALLGIRQALKDLGALK